MVNIVPCMQLIDCALAIGHLYGNGSNRVVEREAVHVTLQLATEGNHSEKFL